MLFMLLKESMLIRRSWPIKQYIWSAFSVKKQAVGKIRLPHLMEGFNRINFNADGYEVLPVIISPERKKQLNRNLLMFFTGFTRFSSEVQKANALNKTDKTIQLKEMLSLVDDAEKNTN